MRTNGAMPVRPAIAPRAFVFDMDGLLLNTEALARRALHEAGAELGLDLTDRFCSLLIGVPTDRTRQLLFEHYGLDAPADRFFAAATDRLEAAIEAGALRLQPGAIELIDRIDAHGMPKAVATSSSHGKALHHLEAAGIARRFDAIVTRDDVTRGKPFPDVFLRAAAAIRTMPANCLALEDSYNGVRSAHAAGMPVVMVPDLLVPDDEMWRLATAIVSDLHAIVRWLDEDSRAIL